MFEEIILLHLGLHSISVFFVLFCFFEHTFLGNQLQLSFQADLIIKSLFVSYTFMEKRAILYK